MHDILIFNIIKENIRVEECKIFQLIKYELIFLESWKQRDKRYLKEKKRRYKWVKDKKKLAVLQPTAISEGKISVVLKSKSENDTF